jgi:AbrB family looped-hinge helix DNA binding protein
MTINSIKLNENYQLTIPKEIRKEILIDAGDEIDVKVIYRNDREKIR